MLSQSASTVRTRDTHKFGRCIKLPSQQQVLAWRASVVLRLLYKDSVRILGLIPNVAAFLRLPKGLALFPVTVYSVVGE